MIIPVGLFLFTLAIYLRTACATFNVADSGETITVCDLLAVGHSPSYPLHALWGRLFCSLPLGQPMWRVTFSSTVSGAFTVLMVYWTLKVVLKPSILSLILSLGNEPEIKTGIRLTEISSICGALIFAFSAEQWLQSCGAKGGIYTLNSLITISIIYFLLKMQQEGWFGRSIFISTFLFGAGLANHWESQLVVAPAYFWLFLSGQKRVPFEELFRSAFRPFDFLGHCWHIFSAFGSKNIIRVSSFCLVSLSVYLYLPLRASQNPAINWDNPRTATSFFQSVTRESAKGYGDKWGWETISRNIPRIWVPAHDQYGNIATIFIFALMVFGIIWLWNGKQRMIAIGLFLLQNFVFWSVVIFTPEKKGNEWVLDYFFTPIFLMISIFAAVGILYLSLLVQRKSGRKGIAVIACCFLLVFSLSPLLLNYPRSDQSRYYAAYDYGMNILKTSKDDGVIICNGDIDLFSLWYLQFVENKRPDICQFTLQRLPDDWYYEPLFKKYPFLATSVLSSPSREIAMMGTLQGIMYRAERVRPFYFTYMFDSYWFTDRYSSVPEGLLWRVLDSKDSNYPLSSSNLNSFYGTYRIRNIDPPRVGYWDEFTEYLRNTYGFSCDYTGLLALQKGLFETALWSFDGSLKYSSPEYYSKLYQLKGDAYLGLMNASAALQSYQEAIKEMPNDPYLEAKMGDAYRMMKDDINAEAAYKISLGMNPNQKEALDGLRKVLKK